LKADEDNSSIRIDGYPCLDFAAVLSGLVLQTNVFTM
jgi:hypothetical protein